MPTIVQAAPEIENDPLESCKTMTDKLAPIHPGEVLLEEFLKPLKLS